MSSLNLVQLIGHLGADPDVKTTRDDRKIVNLSLATSKTWKDKSSGEKRERTQWHRIVIFNEGLAKVAERYLKKGSKIYISGQLETRKFEDQNGNDRYITEVVLRAYKGELIMLSGKGDGERSDYDDRSDSSRAHGGGGGGSLEEMDDQIPFAPEWR